MWEVWQSLANAQSGKAVLRHPRLLPSINMASYQSHTKYGQEACFHLPIKIAANFISIYNRDYEVANLARIVFFHSFLMCFKLKSPYVDYVPKIL